MITGIVCFVGGIFFAAAYPVPSQLIRDQVVRLVNVVKSWFTPTTPK